MVINRPANITRQAVDLQSGNTCAACEVGQCLQLAHGYGWRAKFATIGVPPQSHILRRIGALGFEPANRRRGRALCGNQDRKLRVLRRDAERETILQKQACAFGKVLRRREDMARAADENSRLREAWLTNGQAAQGLLRLEIRAKNGCLAQRASNRCEAGENFLFYACAACCVPARPDKYHPFDVTALQCGKAGGVEPVVIGLYREARFRQIARAGFW